MNVPIAQTETHGPSIPAERGDPDPRPTRKHLAARMAHWSGRHRKTAVLGWLAFAFTLFAFSIVSPMQTIVTETAGPGESGRASTIIYEDFERPGSEQVLIESDSVTADDPEFQAVVRDVIAAVEPLDEVAGVQSPLDGGGAGLVSEDGGTALVQLDFAGPSEDAGDKSDAVVEAVADVQSANPDFYVGSFGESTNKAL